MGRKKKLVNNTDIPQYAIERVARCVLDDIREDYLKEEVLKAFVEWEREWRSYTIKRGLQENHNHRPCRWFALAPLGHFSG